MYSQACRGLWAVLQHRWQRNHARSIARFATCRANPTRKGVRTLSQSPLRERKVDHTRTDSLSQCISLCMIWLCICVLAIVSMFSSIAVISIHLFRQRSCKRDYILWTPAEDALIRTGVQKYFKKNNKPDWVRIASTLESRYVHLDTHNAVRRQSELRVSSFL